MSPTLQISFLRKLATEMEAGILPLDALDAMGQKPGRTGSQAKAAAAKLRSGSQIAEAIATGCPQIPPYLLECIRAGETCGQSARQLSRAADTLETSMEARRRLIGALAYPCTITILAVAVAMGISLFAFPAIIGAIGVGTKLPPISQSLLTTTTLLKNYGPLLLILIGGGTFLLSTARGKGAAMNILRKTPILGRVVKKTEASRVSSALAQMLGAGVDVFQSLKLLEKIAQSPGLKKALSQAERAIRSGATLSESLRNAGLPELMNSALETGERTGKLDTTLARAAGLLEREAEHDKALILGITSNAALILAGIVVGWVVIATYSAIFSLYSGLGQG
jgi:type II secretory pathway component PulF